MFLFFRSAQYATHRFSLACFATWLLPNRFQLSNA
jgi:hypothetical protein